MTHYKRNTPINTILTFDIHGVLFKPDRKKICSLVWHHKRVLSIFFYFLNPTFVYVLLKLLFKRAIPEEYFITLTQKYPSLERYKSLAIAISNAQKPQQDIVHLARRLKNKGYTLHIFSNIGETIFIDLAQRHQDIFTLFDFVHVPTAQTDFMSKSYKQAFHNYLASFNNLNKTIFLIDDNKSNIIKSKQVGIQGIYFTNIDQLRRDLQNYEII